jgi:hypothetical protein
VTRSIWIFTIAKREINSDLELRVETCLGGRVSGVEVADCTQYCTHRLHMPLTVAYWSFGGRSMEVLELKDNRFIIRSL